VRAFAEEIAANAPLAVQAIKRMMRLGLEDSFESNVHQVYLQLLPLFRTQDFQEGVKAFLERRPPRFEGR
jgi:enoyl-CoA hydratase/carnithine racemase